jgi:hypothetical protein
MTTGREGQETAGPGRLLASDADRERVVGILKAAFVEGLLTKNEFGERIGRALTARTHGDLGTLTTDIPATVATAWTREEPARTRRRVGPKAKAGACTLVAAALMLVDAALTGSGAGPTANGFYLLFIVTFVAAFITWLSTISWRSSDRAPGQRPQRPAPGGHDGPARQAGPAAGRVPPAGQARGDVTRATQARTARAPAAQATIIAQPA